MGVPPGGTTQLVFDLPAGVSLIKGRLHHRGGAKVSAQLEVDTAGKSLGELSRGTRAFRVPVSGDAETATFTFQAPKQGRICLEASALGR